MSTYNHAFTLACAVSGSRHEHWLDALNDPVEKPAVIAALRARVDQLEADDHEYREALQGWSDSYEETSP